MQVAGLICTEDLRAEMLYCPVLANMVGPKGINKIVTTLISIKR